MKNENQTPRAGDLKAGPATDLLIANRVMLRDDDRIPYVEAAPFSTDRHYAWRLLEKIQSARVANVTGIGHNFRCVIYEVEGGAGDVPRYVEGFADTFELAICRAALIAAGAAT
jgi:hypothetical protein